jgi:hypothetical protein
VIEVEEESEPEEEFDEPSEFEIKAHLKSQIPAQPNFIESGVEAVVGCSITDIYDNCFADDGAFKQTEFWKKLLGTKIEDSRWASDNFHSDFKEGF